MLQSYFPNIVYVLLVLLKVGDVMLQQHSCKLDIQ
jgi:hypothetical protein